MFSGQLIGVDVGGTKVAVATLEQDRVSESLVRATEASSSDELVDEIVAAVAEMRSESTVVVGGGVSSAGELLLGPAIEIARRFALPGVGERTEIRLARYGSQAGVRGAALLAGLELAGGDEAFAAPRRRWSERERSVQTAPENPFAQDVAQRLPDPTTLVIFGAGGDLAARKLLPAVYNLSLAGLLPDRFGMLGVSRRHDVHSFRKTAREAIQAHSRTGFDEDAWQALEPQLEVVQGDFGNPELFEALAERLERDDARLGATQRVFYLAVAPRFFAQIAKGLAAVGLGAGADPPTRLMIEKPFGHDLDSALGAERRGGLGVRRVAGVPPRPLSRQGDGAEPPGAAVRQRHLRADLEPSLRRPRPDHRRRGSRDRPPRRLLRLGRARFAT